MQNFLINSSICLFSLWLVYKLLLENTSWHRFKRFYLLGSLLVSVVIPFLVVRTVVIPVQQSMPMAFPQFGAVEGTGTVAAISNPGFELDWSLVIMLVYFIGVLIMGIRFARNLYGLRIKSTDEISSYESYILILRKLVEVPHSFFNRIYASATDYEAGSIPDSVLQHEKAHLEQKHSWDILILEILMVAMWFNPLLYLIKYSIKLNHEFLADQAVLSNGINTKTYQETLLAYSANSQNRALANTFNFPIIKKRFTIMKTNTNTASGLLRSLAIVPVLALLVISCGKENTEVELIQNTQKTINIQKEDVSTNIPNSSNDPEVIYAEPGEVITPEIYHKYTTFKKYKTGIQYTDTIIGKDLIYSKKFSDFTEEEKNGRNGFFLTYVPRPEKPKLPSKAEMNEFLDDKVFRIWIDSEEVENEILNNYEPSDFKDYTGRMFVHKTGRKIHPQAFNVMFSTPEYYEKMNKGKQVKYYGDHDATSYESVIKKSGYYNRTVDPSLNLPQQILSHIAFGFNGSALLYLNNERFAYREILTELKKYPNAEIEIGSSKGKSFAKVNTNQKLNDDELKALLNTVSVASEKMKTN
ncbi:M56 family metallopeptidase [Nonlabens antarcticus]|uniref:M56 family metallopeptidase n=1 Tax=Nonlabens antarcticus TaxID=392714 RepID=UPI0018914A38|nr:M56 family metallopeptidase [Nonlabens antarcticus]